jgi:hypothetical protein
MNPETLLMPGNLTTGQAKLEEQCSKGHERCDHGRQTRSSRGSTTGTGANTQ